MTDLTPTANPVAVVLKFLGAAWNANRIEWTSVPADCRPPQVVIGAGDEAEIRAFVAAVQQLAGLFTFDARDPIETVSTPTLSLPNLDGAIAQVVMDGARLSSDFDRRGSVTIAALAPWTACPVTPDLVEDNDADL